MCPNFLLVVYINHLFLYTHEPVCGCSWSTWSLCLLIKSTHVTVAGATHMIVSWRQVHQPPSTVYLFWGVCLLETEQGVTPGSPVFWVGFFFFFCHFNGWNSYIRTTITSSWLTLCTQGSQTKKEKQHALGFTGLQTRHPVQFVIFHPPLT